MRPRANHSEQHWTGGAPPRPRSAELIGGPLDGLTIGEPLEPYAQFILLPADGRGGGPFPIHTYLRLRGQQRYLYCGRGTPALPR